MTVRPSSNPPRPASDASEGDLGELEDLRNRLAAALAQNTTLRVELRRIETELRITKLVIASFNSETFTGA